jgi:hypothetical protein
VALVPIATVILQDNLGYNQSGHQKGRVPTPFSFYLDSESRNSASRRPDELWGKVRRFWSVSCFEKGGTLIIAKGLSRYRGSSQVRRFKLSKPER